MRVLSVPFILLCYVICVVRHGPVKVRKFFAYLLTEQWYGAISTGVAIIFTSLVPICARDSDAHAAGAAIHQVRFSSYSC